MRRFEASPRRAAPKGHQSLISRTAPPTTQPTYPATPPVFVAHLFSEIRFPSSVPGPAAQLRAVGPVRSHRARLLVGVVAPISRDPVPESSFVDTQFSSDLGDRTRV